jgi:hypothetical protein
MPSNPQRFLVDERGQRLGVVLDMKEYERIAEDLEELDAIRAFDQAKASSEKPRPWKEARKRLLPNQE